METFSPFCKVCQVAEGGGIGTSISRAAYQKNNPTIKSLTCNYSSEFKKKKKKANQVSKLNCAFLQLSSKCAFWLCGAGGFVIYIIHMHTYILHMHTYMWYIYTRTHCTYLHITHMYTYILYTCTRACFTYVHVIHLHTYMLHIYTYVWYIYTHYTHTHTHTYIHIHLIHIYTLYIHTRITHRSSPSAGQPRHLAASPGAAIYLSIIYLRILYLHSINRESCLQNKQSKL